MSEKSDDVKIRNHLRKELRPALRETLGELMTTADFDTMTRQLWYIDDMMGSIGHFIRSKAQNDILQKSEEYPEILQMMRDNKDKKKIAKRIKQALEDEGYKTSDITAKRDEALNKLPMYQLLYIMKQQSEKELLRSLLRKNIWNYYLQHVTGVSVLTASKLLYLVDDATRFPQPSKLIKYSGLAVVDGEAERLRSGEAAGYNPELKALLLGVIGGNLMRSKSQYRVAYDERRERMEKERPSWGEHPSGKDEEYNAHYHNDAKRYMVKRFVQEFWDASYLCEGAMPPSKPYAVAILGHDMEPKIVPVTVGDYVVYRWNECGVQDKLGRVLCDWVEWAEVVNQEKI